MPNKKGLCWRCGAYTVNKPSWKAWPQGVTCVPCRETLAAIANAQFEAKKYAKTAGAKYVVPLQKWVGKDAAYSEYKVNKKVVTTPDTGMKKGDIRKIPTSSSPVWTSQWAVQGTGKVPYIVSHKKNAAGSSLEWQCSCPAWTTTMPREDCKHVLKVKLVEGFSLAVTNTGTKEFVKMTNAPDAPKPLTVKTGRKFR